MNERERAEAIERGYRECVDAEDTKEQIDDAVKARAKAHAAERVALVHENKHLQEEIERLRKENESQIATLHKILDYRTGNQWHKPGYFVSWIEDGILTADEVAGVIQGRTGENQCPNETKGLGSARDS